MTAALIAKLESASEGSRELDGEVAEATVGFMEWDGKPVTISIDAALALAERVLPGCCLGVSKNVHSGLWFAWLGYEDKGEAMLHAQTHGHTAPLAIVAALIRATAKEESRL